MIKGNKKNDNDALIQQLRVCSNQVGNPNTTREQIIKLAAQMKKSYGLLKQANLKNGNKIPIHFIFELINEILPDANSPQTDYGYQRIKTIGTINEFLQMLAADFTYEELMDFGTISKARMENEQKMLYSIILGNDGTRIDKKNDTTMTPELIEEVLKRKILANREKGEPFGINREDVLSLLEMLTDKMYQDVDGYQKIINVIISSGLTQNGNGEKFTNEKILDVFSGLIKSYEEQGNSSMQEEIYKKGIGITSLKGTPAYEEFEKKYMSFMAIKYDFDSAKFKDFNSLMGALKKNFISKDIFSQDNAHTTRSKSDNPKGKKLDYIMPVKDKLKAFEETILKLKKDNPDCDIVDCKIGKNSYKGYVIFKVKGTEISILENFNDVNGRLFVVRDDKIHEVIGKKRQEVRNEDGNVIGVKHVKNLRHYKENILKAFANVMGKEHEEKETTYRFLENPDGFPKAAESTPIDETKSSKTEIKPETESEDESITEIEEEKRKVLKKLEYLAELEQKLADIKTKQRERLSQLSNLEKELKGEGK